MHKLYNARERVIKKSYNRNNTLKNIKNRQSAKMNSQLNKYTNECFQS